MMDLSTAGPLIYLFRFTLFASHTLVKYFNNVNESENIKLKQSTDTPTTLYNSACPLVHMHCHAHIIFTGLEVIFFLPSLSE